MLWARISAPVRPLCRPGDRIRFDYPTNKVYIHGRLPFARAESAAHLPQRPPPLRGVPALCARYAPAPAVAIHVFVYCAVSRCCRKRVLQGSISLPPSAPGSGGQPLTRRTFLIERR